MKALVFDGEALRYREDYAEPVLRDGWAVIQVTRVGVCRTDVEITRGYMAFEGVLGHELLGVVAESSDESWLGQRVVGEINAACGRCRWCEQDLGRHCPEREVMGIKGLDGCMADYCTLPIANLHRVPDEIPDDQAVFTEPLSAAYEILDQVPLEGSERCLVLGDGKLGILCAWVLTTVLSDVTLVGHHNDKLELASWDSLQTTLANGGVEPGADLVIEATGSGQGLADAMSLCRPRGTLVLKSTVADQGTLNLAPIVVDEIQVVGSRCGLFAKGLDGMKQHLFPVERLIAERYQLDDGERAVRRAGERGVLKVLLDIGP